MDDLSENELDQFDSRREKILLDAAGGALASDSDYCASDQEVMELQHQSHSDAESAEDEEEEGKEGAESENEGWGSKRNYYGGDDSSDDEDARLNVEEALKQQKKHLQELHMDDFVDEDIIADWKKVQQAYLEEQVTADDQAVDFDAMDEADKLKHLQGLYPEFLPLVREFSALQPRLAELQRADASDAVAAKISALSAYLSCISSYLALFVDKLKCDRALLKDHPVMETILRSREVWRQTDELRTERQRPVHSGTNKVDSITHYVDDAVDAEVDDDGVDMGTDDTDGQIIDTDSEAEEANQASDESDKELHIDFNAKRAIRRPAAVNSAGDYTETAVPDSVDKEEKKRHKKSLRFYTSKINQAAEKNARNEKFAGDLDLPYKERLFERQKRLLEEARKRGMGADLARLGEDLDGTPYVSDDDHMAREINADATDYYDAVRQAKQMRKETRRAAHEASKLAARDGKLAELQESISADGKRALNFQILKNKGLTPQRKNENRNSRVKKRKKYEQAKKKLRSVRQVHEANAGPYGGEKTGIKKNFSRSVKLR